MARGDGSVYYDKRRGVWRAYLWVDGKRRNLPDQPNQESARRAHRAALVRRDEQRFSDTPRQTTRGFLERWWSTQCLSTRASTAYNRQYVLAHLVAQLGHHQLRDLTPPRIDRAYTTLATTVGRATAHNAAIMLRQALTQAVAWDLLPSNPAQRVKTPTYRAEPKPTLTAAQARQLITSSAASHTGPIIAVMLMTGIRPGEAMALRWSDIALDAGTLSVDRTLIRTADGFTEGQPKTASSRRTVSLSPGTVTYLREYQRRHRTVFGTQPLVFPNSNNAQRKPPGFRLELQAECDRAGVPRMTPHQLRHTHGSLDIQTEGSSLKHLQERLGHASITTTANVYTHTDRASHQAKISRLDAVLQPGQSNEPTTTGTPQETNEAV